MCVCVLIPTFVTALTEMSACVRQSNKWVCIRVCVIEKSECIGVCVCVCVSITKHMKFKMRSAGDDKKIN